MPLSPPEPFFLKVGRCPFPPLLIFPFPIIPRCCICLGWVSSLCHLARPLPINSTVLNLSHARHIFSPSPWPSKFRLLTALRVHSITTSNSIFTNLLQPCLGFLTSLTPQPSGWVSVCLTVRMGRNTLSGTTLRGVLTRSTHSRDRVLAAIVTRLRNFLLIPEWVLT